jgi:hypothetical protein
MKKVLAILFAMMFMVATTGLCFAQAAPAKTPEKAAADKKAADKKTAADKKAADEKKAAPAPAPEKK